MTTPESEAIRIIIREELARMLSAIAAAWENAGCGNTNNAPAELRRSLARHLREEAENFMRD